MVDKAIDVAVQESARYFAEGIARIEKARAYIDRVMYQYAHDPDCVAFKWKLSSPIHAMTCATCTHTDLWGMGEGIFQNNCWQHAGKAPMALKRRGAVIFLVFQSICGSDEAGNHDLLAGSDSASIFIFFHPKARHICYNKSNIVKF